MTKRWRERTRLYDLMTKRLARSVEKPGARHPDAMNPSFISDRQITWSLTDHEGRFTQNVCTAHSPANCICTVQE